jgi:hypothetical protein
MVGRFRDKVRLTSMLIASLAIVLVNASIASAGVKPIEVEAYQEAFDVPSVVAKDRLQIQAKGAKADIVGDLEQRLDENFAGIWFDNASGEFVVPVAGANRAAVGGEFSDAGLTGDYRTVAAQSSWKELKAAQERVDAEWRGMLDSDAIEAGVVRTSIDARANAVVVQMAAGMNGKEASIVTQMTRGLGVRVELRESDAERFRATLTACSKEYRNCGLPMRGGVEFGPHNQIGNACTTAFRARGNTNGKRYVLSAGHCAALPDPNNPVIHWDAWDEQELPYFGEAHYLGQAEQVTFPGHDWMKINATGTDWDVSPWPARVAYWGQNQEYPIYGEASSIQGSTVCHSGITTGASCGKVIAVNSVSEEFDGIWLHDLTAVEDACNAGGDSGGPWFASNTAYGIHNGYDLERPSCGKGSILFYTEITEATDALNAHVVANFPSQTTVYASPKQCPASSVHVSGSVTSDGSPVVSGQVTISLWKWENNQWVFKESAQTGVGSSSYGRDFTGLSAGKWRTKAALAPVEGLSGSESGYQEFVIEPIAGIDENDASPGPRVVAQCNGTVDVFYRDTNGDLGHQWFTSANGWLTETRAASIAPSSSPRAVAQPNGTIDVFFRTPSGDLGHHWFTSGNGWMTETRAASMASDPHVVAQPNGTIDVFYRDTSNNLGHQWYTSGNSWMTETRAASMASDPQVLARSNGTVDVFYRDTNGNLGHQWYTSGGSWLTETRAASIASSSVPRAVVQPNGTIDVFYRDTSGNLGHHSYIPGGSWLTETRAASIAPSSVPRAVAQPNGTVDVFYRDTNGDLGHHWFTSANGWLTETRPASMGSDPHAVVQLNGTVDVFYRTPSGDLGHQWFTSANGWLTETRAASMASAPHEVVQSNGTVDVVYRDTSGNLGHQWFTSANGWLTETRAASIAPKPPLATTEAAASITANSATVKAGVNPEGSPAEYYFEYGTTTAYGSKTAAGSEGIGSWSASAAVSQALGGLSPVTTYHYRVVATSPEGAAYGQDKTFTTTASTPIVSAESATGVSATQATLPGSVNPQGMSTGYRFEYGKTTAYGTSVPVPDKNVGSGTGAVAVSESVSGLSPATTYHYRLVATNGVNSAATADKTFETAPTPVQLAAMATTKAFDGSSASLADFAANWSALGWASGSTPKGADTATGWGPVDASPTANGTFFNPGIADGGSGIATVATLAARPAAAGRYFSLWLDMPSPGGASRTGYELRLTELFPNEYQVALSKWQAGVKTSLATKSSSFAVGTQFALLDKGGTVSAWTKTGSEFTQLLSAEDGAFAAGSAGLEGTGTPLRLTNFKTGSLLSAVTNMDAALKGLPMVDNFNRGEVPLSNGGAWSALSWANGGAGKNTGQTVGAFGWSPYDAYPTINGAYWTKATMPDTGAGVGVAATLMFRSFAAGRYFSLWLDMPSPATTRTGYELRFTETTSGVYDVTVAKWQAGTKTTLATKAGHSFAAGNQFALVDKGGTVSAWTKAGAGEFTQLLSAEDTAFIAGSVGIEGSGTNNWLRDFRSGSLAPF